MDAAKVDTIIELIATKGYSARKACETVGVDHGNWFHECAANDELAHRYARACTQRADVLFEDLVELADIPPPTIGEDGHCDRGWVDNQRLRIDTRKWAASKLHPSKYSDKQEVQHSGGVTLNVSVKGDAPDV